MPDDNKFNVNNLTSVDEHTKGEIERLAIKLKDELNLLNDNVLRLENRVSDVLMPPVEAKEATPPSVYITGLGNYLGGALELVTSINKRVIEIAERVAL